MVWFDCKICGVYELRTFQSRKYPRVCCCCAAKTYGEINYRHYHPKTGEKINCQKYAEYQLRRKEDIIKELKKRRNYGRQIDVTDVVILNTGADYDAYFVFD